MQSNDIIDVLENDEAISFINKHTGSDTASLQLRYSSKVNFNLTVTLQLMAVYSKASKKIPLFSEKYLAIDKRSYEQCTSAAIAKYKQNFIGGNSLLDLTAGIGVDSLFLSSSFKTIIAVERNLFLHDLAVYNIDKLGIKNLKRVQGEGIELLNKAYDWVYIDPDRRKDENRSVALHLLEPNVLELLPKLIQFATKVYIKLSPLFDIAMVWRQFDHVRDVYILAEKGEIKELGVVLDWSYDKVQQVHLVDVTSGFNKRIAREKLEKRDLSAFSENVIRFIHLPFSLLLKARATLFFIQRMNVKKHSDFEVYFSSQSKIEGFRSFQIIERSSLRAKSIKKMLKNHQINQVNIVVKGMNEKASFWHKKIATRDGGSIYLMLLKGAETEAVLAELITS